MFNRNLTQLVSTGRIQTHVKRLIEKGVWKPTRVGRKVKEACLTFENDLVLITHSIQRSEQQFIQHSVSVQEMSGYKYPLGKLNLFARKSIYTIKGRIKRTSHFQFLRVILEPIGIKQDAHVNRIETYGHVHKVYKY